MLRSRLISPLAILIVSTSALLAQQPAATATEDNPAVDRAMRHATTEWAIVAPHLPDPATATPAILQQAGDILRARRFLEDALEYYAYAIKRGGDEASLDNRIGVTELELGQPALARVYFRHCIALSKKDAEGWNNLGAVETISGNPRQAISDYQRAVKINRKNSLFHANLGTAYFAVKDYESARHEFEVAVNLDPQVFQRGGFGGSLVHVLSADDRGQFAFEMARLAAAHGEEESMLHWLAQASEAGLNLREAMPGIKEFAPYLKDARIALIIHNTQALRNKELAVTDPVPSLAAAKTESR
jgi:tetratricopeptide (TPR) repeat protein